jgi:hypothetical protein
MPTRKPFMCRKRKSISAERCSCGKILRKVRGRTGAGVACSCGYVRLKFSPPLEAVQVVSIRVPCRRMPSGDGARLPEEVQRTVGGGGSNSRIDLQVQYDE